MKPVFWNSPLMWMKMSFIFLSCLPLLIIKAITVQRTKHVCCYFVYCFIWFYWIYMEYLLIPLILLPGGQQHHEAHWAHLFAWNVKWALVSWGRSVNSQTLFHSHQVYLQAGDWEHSGCQVTIMYVMPVYLLPSHLPLCLCSFWIRPAVEAVMKVLKPALGNIDRQHWEQSGDVFISSITRTVRWLL